MGPYNSLICTGEKEAVRILTFLLFPPCGYGVFDLDEFAYKDKLASLKIPSGNSKSFPARRPTAEAEIKYIQRC